MGRTELQQRSDAAKAANRRTWVNHKRREIAATFTKAGFAYTAQAVREGSYDREYGLA